MNEVFSWLTEARSWVGTRLIRWPPTAETSLAVVLVLALVFKSAYLLLYARRSPFYSAPAADSEVYVLGALTMADEGLVGREVYYRAPLYPYFIYPLLRIAGFHPFGLLGVQLLLGWGNLVLLYLIGRRIYGKRAGVLAALLGLLYAPMTFYETKILPTVLGMFLGLLLVLWLTAAEQERKGRFWFAGAAALGLAIICRPHYAPVFPLVIAGLVVRYRSQLKALRAPLLILVLTVTGIVGTVTLRNLLVSGDFVPISANAGVTFAQGNTEGARGSLTSIPGLPNAVATQQLQAKRLAERRVGRALSPSEVSAYWFRHGLRFIAEDPGRYLHLLLSKAALMLNNRELASCYLLRLDLEMFPLLRLAFVPFGFIAAWAAVGLVVLARGRKGPIVLYATFFGSVLTMLVFYVNTRYRMTLAPVAIVLAGVGLDFFLGSWRDPKRLVLTGSAALAIFLCSLPPFLPMRKELIDIGDGGYWANLAISYQLRGRTPEARDAIERAIRLDPNEAAYHMMRFDYVRGTLDGPEQELREAERLRRRFPKHAGGYCRTASALIRLGRNQQAIAAYQTALKFDPGSVEALYGLGVLYGSMGRFDLARQLLGRGLQQNPNHVGLQYSYALACWQTGRTEESRYWLTLLLRRVPNHPQASQLLARMRQKR